MSAADYLKCVEVEPPGPARSAVIWLHGLGADGHDFEPIVPHLELDPSLGVRFVFPHAPRRPVTINMGMVMPAWYDVVALDLRRDQDVEGITDSAAHVRALIARENRRGIPTERIVLAGFSQGGAIALHTALRFEAPLAGVLALSSYLPLATSLAREKRADPARLAIRMDHGDRDPVVPYRVAERSRSLIEAQGYQVEFHSYAMEHSLCLQQMESLCSWLSDRLGEAAARHN